MEEVVKKKKGHGFAIFLLCIAFALIGAGASYYYLTVYMHQGVQQPQTNQKEEVKELPTTGVLVNELISRIDYSTCGMNADLYKKSKTTVNEMNEDYKRLLIVKEAIGKRVEKDITFQMKILIMQPIYYLEVLIN